MARIIVCAARSWSFRDEKTQELRAGITVDGTEGNQNDEADYKGRGAVEYTASDEAWKTLSAGQLPAICDVELGTRKARSKAGKPVAVASIEQVMSMHPIDFAAVPAARKAA
jgi:hypothetical protein